MKTTPGSLRQPAPWPAVLPLPYRRCHRSPARSVVTTAESKHAESWTAVDDWGRAGLFCLVSAVRLCEADRPSCVVLDARAALMDGWRWGHGASSDAASLTRSDAIPLHLPESLLLRCYPANDAEAPVHATCHMPCQRFTWPRPRDDRSIDRSK